MRLEAFFIANSAVASRMARMSRSSTPCNSGVHVSPPPDVPSTCFLLGDIVVQIAAIEQPGLEAIAINSVGEGGRCLGVSHVAGG